MATRTLFSLSPQDLGPCACEARSNSSQHGMETTAAPMPSACSFVRASTAMETSEPVAISVTAPRVLGAAAGCSRRGC